MSNKSYNYIVVIVTHLYNKHNGYKSIWIIKLEWYKGVNELKWYKEVNETNNLM